MTMKCRLWSWPIWNARTTFGWSSWVSSRPSRWNRASTRPSFALLAGNTLMATIWPDE